MHRLFDEVVHLAPEARAPWLDEACRDDPALRREVEALLAADSYADNVFHDLDHPVSRRPEASRWEKLGVLFERALTQRPEHRAAFLDQACSGDASLRAELSSLLAAYKEAPDYFNQLAGAVLPPGLAKAAVQGDPDPYGLIGRTVSHYRIEAKLGGGGMGIVYKARDLKLDRTVALKFLPPHLSTDEQAKRRFVHEAKAASALDHSNIGYIHEIGETNEGRLFIAMAYHAGETLKEKIERGPLSVEDAICYAMQMAEGLSRAHEGGIVHRDVKPANVMVTDQGQVKIVDFGLAKVQDVSLTRTGMILGTVAYMSPEQARGEAVDHQADVWALGVVLYEMLTGERPFTGDYEQAIIYSILNIEPEPLRAVNPDVPEDLEHVVTMCLEKEKAYRYPTMADLLADLDVLKQGGAPGLTSTLPKRSARPARVPRRVLAGVGILVSILVMLLAVSALRQVVPGLGRAALPAQRYLAVLPFDNIGGNPENQAFIDGLVYTVTGKLTEMEQFQDALSVVPARDVLQAGLFTSAAIADRFDVNLVVSGSVQRTPDRVRVILQVIDPRQEKVLASRQIDEPTMDIAALQDGVVFNLAELLAVELNPATEQALTAGRTADPDAFDFYIQALGYLQGFEDETNLDAAISLFGLAIKEDSSYALAYAGLGEAYLRKYQARNVPALVDEALQYGERAVDLDEDLAPVRVTLGMIYFETGRYELAELEYLRALALEPKNAAAYHVLGAVYARQNKNDKAEASYQEAIALKPGYWLYYNDLGQFYHRLGRHRDAIPVFKKVIALQPDNPWGYNNVGAQYTRLGRPEEAIPWYEQAAQKNPNATQATAVAYWNLAGIYYGQDDFAQAARTYEKVVGLQEADRDAWESLGDAYYWAGEREKARTAWQRAIVLAHERLTINQNDATFLGYLAEDYARLGALDSARVAIDRLLAQDERSTASLLSVAKAYEIMGYRDQAVQYIGEALDRGYAPAILEFSAWLDNLRADARYRELVREYHIQEADS